MYCPLPTMIFRKCLRNACQNFFFRLRRADAFWRKTRLECAAGEIFSERKIFQCAWKIATFREVKWETWLKGHFLVILDFWAGARDLYPFQMTQEPKILGKCCLWSLLWHQKFWWKNDQNFFEKWAFFDYSGQFSHRSRPNRGIWKSGKMVAKTSFFTKVKNCVSWSLSPASTSRPPKSLFDM